MQRRQSKNILQLRGHPDQEPSMCRRRWGRSGAGVGSKSREQPQTIFIKMAMLAAHALAQTAELGSGHLSGRALVRPLSCPRFADLKDARKQGPCQACSLAPKQWTRGPQTSREGLTSLLLQGLRNAGLSRLSRVLASH